MIIQVNVIKSDHEPYGGRPAGSGYRKNGRIDEKLRSEICLLSGYDFENKNRNKWKPKRNVIKWLKTLCCTVGHHFQDGRTRSKDLYFQISNFIWFPFITSVAEMLSITIYLKLIRENVESNPGMNQNKNMLAILTYNCNGLGDPKKLKRLLYKASSIVDKGCVVFLQETHIVDTSYLSSIWKNKFESNCTSTNSAGVITLYKNSFDLVDCYKDPEGRQLTIVLKDEDRYIIATNVYFPNDHKKGLIFAEQVYLKILEFQHKYPDNYTLLAGDFNMCLNEKDYINRKSTVNEKILSETIILNNITTNLVDTYRVAHDSGGYTWNRGNCYSRLDYVFVSSHLKSNILKVEHNWNFESSDHAALKISFALNDTLTRGPGICKVNTMILEDPKVVQQIRNDLTKYLEQVDSSWNPHTTLEFLKVAIRSVFSEKVSEVGKYQHNEISETEDEINQLENLKIKILTEQNNLDIDHKITNINIATTKLKTRLHQLRNKASANQSFRSKAKWFEYGEKSNKFFLNLLKSRQNQRLIGKISNQGKVYNGQEEVTIGITNFYKELYNSKDRIIADNDNDDYYKHCPKLNNDQAQIMDQELTLENLSEALKSCKDSSPGPDGIPYKIYKTYWDITGPIILKSWHYSKEIGKLAPSHNESVITLLPKEGKDMGDIKNWRPITLSNCDSKIITKALTMKISKVLDSIIDVSQTAYIPGRSVADNLRSNFYLKTICKNKNIDSLLISLDAKKAFDSVDHNYIKETLYAYGFGENFIKTFNLLYKEITSRVLINGYLSEAIKIKRGVKQGDSLSCALFIICIDPLLRNINNSHKIRSIKPDVDLNLKQSKYFKAGAYADDISVVCPDDRLSVQEVFNEYNRLTLRSGLELNADKTEVLRLNTHVTKKISFYYNSQDVEIETVNKIKICGLYYSFDKEIEYNLNVIEKIKKLSIKIKQWIPRHLTMEGKSLIIKTFGLSQLIYNMQSYGFHKKDLKNIESIIFKFIWSSNDNQNGIDRIKRSVMKNDYENGGMKITDVECLDKSLKLRQFIRAQNSNHFIATIQQILTSRDGEIKQEYTKCTDIEEVCSSAQEALNIITDYNREQYKKLDQEEFESDKNLINEISSINLKTYLKRKNRVLAVCILKNLNDLGITTLGELMSAYEYEENTNINKAMKLIINSFPLHIINIAKCYNDELNSDREKYEYMLTKPHTRILITTISTKDFQITLKNALNRIEKPDFNVKLDTINFDPNNITNFRNNCRNSKLRNIYFRLIHNDFFTHSRMFRYKMTPNDKCPRCGEVESTKHLLWECHHVRHIWALFNELARSVGGHRDQAHNYEDVYTAATSAAVNLVKIRLIQEMIQIERPRDWTKLHITKILNELINFDKYNSAKTHSIINFTNKWGALTNLPSSSISNITNQTR